jgi:hypothetical protein
MRSVHSDHVDDHSLLLPILKVRKRQDRNPESNIFSFTLCKPRLERAMANAHLPNSHPEVTPGYRPFSYPTTPFAQAISTKLVDGTDNCFAGFAPRDWCNQGKFSRNLVSVQN